MVPASTDIRRRHGAARICRDASWVEGCNVQPIVAKEQGVSPAELLIDTDHVVIGIVYLRTRHDRVEYGVSGEIGLCVVRLDEIDHGRIEARGGNHIGTAGWIRTSGVEIWGTRIGGRNKQS